MADSNRQPLCLRAAPGTNLHNLKIPLTFSSNGAPGIFLKAAARQYPGNKDGCPSMRKCLVEHLQRLINPWGSAELSAPSQGLCIPRISGSPQSWILLCSLSGYLLTRGRSSPEPALLLPVLPAPEQLQGLRESEGVNAGGSRSRTAG